MPRPRLEGAAELVRGRERQEAAGGDDVGALDDDGPVVERGVGEEQADQEVLGEEGIDLDADGPAFVVAGMVLVFLLGGGRRQPPRPTAFAG